MHSTIFEARTIQLEKNKLILTNWKNIKYPTSVMTLRIAVLVSIRELERGVGACVLACLRACVLAALFLTCVCSHVPLCKSSKPIVAAVSPTFTTLCIVVVLLNNTSRGCGSSGTWLITAQQSSAPNERAKAERSTTSENPRCWDKTKSQSFLKVPPAFGVIILFPGKNYHLL